MEDLVDWMSPGMLGWVAASFVLAGFVKGVSGMGLPTLAMALLSLRMPAAPAAALMLLPALLTNVAQCMGRHGGVLLRQLWPLWLGLVLGTLFAPVPGLGSAAARHTLGAVLVGYGLFGLARPHLPSPGRHTGWLGLLAGGLGGALSAATGVFVMPLVPYLQALQLPRAALIQALGISFMLASLALAARLGGLEAAAPPHAGGGVPARAVRCVSGAGAADARALTAARERRLPRGQPPRKGVRHEDHPPRTHDAAPRRAAARTHGHNTAGRPRHPLRGGAAGHAHGAARGLRRAR